MLTRVLSKIRQLPKKLKRLFRFSYQKQKRGFSDKDTWNLDVTFARFIVPRLIRFKEMNHGFPADLTDDSWNSILDDMIYSFESITKEFDHNFVPDNDRIQKGLDLFAKYYRGLWW